MRSLSVEEKLAELGWETPEQAWFETVGDLTALRWSESQGFYRSNYSRGPLLYSLISHYQPSVVMEVGTGRGYGTVCMARAMVDGGIDGRVYTVDAVAPGEAQTWAIDHGDGPELALQSLDEVWGDHFDGELRERIVCVTGSSREVLSGWSERGLSAPDFGFLDAGHRYEEIRFDFYAFLEAAGTEFAVLFDDYRDGRDFGVKRFVDEDLASVYEPELLTTEWRQGDLDTSPAGMVLIDSRMAPRELPPDEVARRLADARRQLGRLGTKDRLKSVVRPIARALRVR